MKNKRIAYECTDGNGCWSYPTEAEAREQLQEMANGFPKNEYMSEENRGYWKRASARYYITKVVETTTRL